MTWHCSNCGFDFEIVYSEKYQNDNDKIYACCPKCETYLGAEVWGNGVCYKFWKPIEGEKDSFMSVTVPYLHEDKEGIKLGEMEVAFPEDKPEPGLNSKPCLTSWD